MPTRKHVANTVKAYAQRHRLSAEQIPTVVAAVHAALSACERGTYFVPAVPIKRAVRQSRRRAKAIGSTHRAKEAGIVGEREGPVNIIEKAMVRLASETKLRGILTPS
jgi:hypothetical protein